VNKKIFIQTAMCMLFALNICHSTGGTMTGNGTTNDPFLVADYSDLKMVGTTTTYSLSAVYRLIADIDASLSATEHSDSGFVPIGSTGMSFSGSFHGAGHVIKHLYINRPTTDYVGLFGFISFATIIDSLGLVDNIISGNSAVGSIAGFADFTAINSCYNTGSIYGKSETGGIVGFGHSIEITRCYNTGNIYGSSGSVGGINGYIYGSSTINNCYNTGIVSSPFAVGGIVGFSHTIIDNCYNVGSVSGAGQVGGIVGHIEYGTILSDSYWNIQSSGQSSAYGDNSEGGTVTAVIGLTSAEMKNSSNFGNLDFASMWNIHNDSTYPGLRSVSDNAPFAFADTFSTGRTFTLSQLLSNDCDIETVRANLVLKVASVSSGITDSISILNFPYNISNGTIISIRYRVGEGRTSDTLWGNIATSIITLDTTYIVGVSEEGSIMPKKITLYQNYPNPFNPSTTITFDLPKQSNVKLNIFDVLGRKVITLVNETKAAGSYHIKFDASGLTSGIYYYRLNINASRTTKKMVLMK
jgi:hypothetical protein